jgi:hypothetical protein
VVLVFVLAAERRDLVGDAVAAYDDGPEAVLVERLRVKGEEPLGAGVGREIPVRGRPTEESVAERAADDVRGMPRGP